MIRIFLIGCGLVASMFVGATAEAQPAHNANAAAVRQDYEAAVAILRKAAAAGDVPSQFVLGAVLYFGRWQPSVKADQAEGLKWFRIAADHNNVDAQLLLARETKDRAEALNWYQKAAMNGNAEAQERIGKAYWWADGRPRDVKVSIQWFQKAAEGGNSNAQLLLGVQYAIGEAIPRDFVQSRRWFLKLAASSGPGSRTAQDYLGTFYEKGLGVSQNYAEAIRWYEDAVKDSYAPYAEFSLGTLHQFGRGVPVNLERALGFYRASALKGYPPAQYRMGIAYLKGEGVRPDRAEALKWLAFSVDLDLADMTALPQHESVKSDVERNPDLFHLLTGQLRPEAYDYALTTVRQLAKDPALHAKAKALVAAYQPTPPPPLRPHP